MKDYVLMPKTLFKVAWLGSGTEASSFSLKIGCILFYMYVLLVLGVLRISFFECIRTEACISRSPSLKIGTSSVMILCNSSLCLLIPLIFAAKDWICIYAKVEQYILYCNMPTVADAYELQTCLPIYAKCLSSKTRIPKNPYHNSTRQ
jgi:hypothetical protein